MSKRRVRGDGSIYQRSDGYWVASVDLGWKDGTRRRKTLYGKTRAEVASKLREAQRRVDAGIPLPNDQLTVAKHVERWLTETLPGRVSPSTLANYATLARTHVIPEVGRKRLSALTPADVQALLRRKTAAGLSPATVRAIRGVLVRSIKQAERWDLVQRNVAALTDGPKLARPEGRSLTLDEARRFLDAASGDRLEALYTVLLSLGLRRGEALGLAWADVDLDAGTLTIRRSLKREEGRIVIGEVKTAGSRRLLNLPAPTADSLRAHRARQATERLRAGEAWTDRGLVFCTTIGTPLDPDNFRRSFSQVCERAGLGHWHPHELRHSAASLLLAQGVALEVVSELLGHASIRMTKDVYGHLIGDQKREAAEAMGRALFGS